MARTTAKMVAEFVIDARLNGIKPSAEEFRERFPKCSKMMRGLLEQLGEIERMPRAAYGSRVPPDERRQRQIDSLSRRAAKALADHERLKREAT